MEASYRCKPVAGPARGRARNLMWPGERYDLLDIGLFRTPRWTPTVWRPSLLLLRRCASCDYSFIIMFQTGGRRAGVDRQWYAKGWRGGGLARKASAGAGRMSRA